MNNLIYKALIIILICLLPSSLLEAQEICFNRIDDDGDGLIDCLDPECYDADSCWDCITEFYQVHSNSIMVSLDPASGIYNQIGTVSGASAINGAQFNHIDGHVYAPCIINGEHKLGMLYQDGTVVDLGLNLPGNSVFYVGAIDANGKMYLSNASGIHSVELTAEELSVVDTGVPHPGVADFALDLTNGLFYGIAGAGVLKVFDPIQLSVSSYDLAGSIVSDSGGYGAAWSCVDGSFFAYNNSSGKIYSVNVNDLTATYVLNATGNLSINDGFNCVLSDPPFETKCANGIDDDGDGLPDCDDPDCFNSNSCIVEICNNGIDDDLDGWADCDDTECQYLEWCIEICDNGIDDNGNGDIDAADAQCTTQSGVTGGLESNQRLADKIAKRNFQRAKQTIPVYQQKEAGLIPYQNDLLKSELSIEDFIPESLWNGYVAESSPDDLVNITNASAVVSADYYVNDLRVGTVLGIESIGGVYEHAKYICDRSEGARLIDISYLYSNGGNFISYELLTTKGTKEYAVSFSAKKEDGAFTIESHWDLDDYPEVDQYYNFQIWAQTYPALIELLEAVLDKMKVEGDLASIHTSAMPMVFVRQVSYKNGEVKLRVRNKNNAETLSISGLLRKTETSDAENYTSTVTLSGAGEEWVYLDTPPIYDFGISLMAENDISDEVFIADGAWGLDAIPAYTQVHSFEVQEESELTEEDVYALERSVNLKALVKDYVSVYRSVGAKFLANDLTDYNSLVFEASGEGLMEVTLVKESIDLWEHQFRASIYLGESSETIQLQADDFVSILDTPFDWDDLTMVVFTIKGNQQSFEEKSLAISSLRFELANSVGLEVSRSDSDLKIGQLSEDLLFIEYSDYFDATSVEVYNASGILVKSIQLKDELQSTIEVFDLTPGVYFLNLIGESGKLTSARFMRL